VTLLYTVPFITSHNGERVREADSKRFTGDLAIGKSIRLGLLDFCESEQSFEVKPQFRQCFSSASLPIDDEQS
jgi:hypothetical protein